MLISLLACSEKTDLIEEQDDIPVPSDSTGVDTDSDDTPEQYSTTDYAFDDNDSLLYVQVFKDPDAAASGLAHDHVMRATNWNGFVSYNPSDITECAMQFSIPVHDLRVDEDSMRELVGYGDTISQTDRDTIREHMLAENQLHASQNPTISFVSSECELADEGNMIVTGDMAIRNEVQRWNIDIEYSAHSETFYMTSTIEFNHSDFGIEPYSAFFGAVRNAEPLRISFDMVGYQ